MDQVARRIIGEREARVVIAAALAVVLAFLIPVARALFDLNTAREMLRVAPEHLTALRNGVTYSLLAALMTVCISVLFVVAVLPPWPRGRRWRMGTIALLALFATTASRLTAWVLLLTETGPVTTVFRSLNLLPRHLPLSAVPTGLVLVLSSVQLPSAIFLFLSYCDRVSVRADEAAVLLGRRTLPGVRIRRRSLWSAATVTLVITFVGSHAAFMVPSILGGRAGWFATTSIDLLLNMQADRESALALATGATWVALSCALCLAAISQRYSRKS